MSAPKDMAEVFASLSKEEQTSIIKVWLGNKIMSIVSNIDDHDDEESIAQMHAELKALREHPLLNAFDYQAKDSSISLFASVKEILDS